MSAMAERVTFSSSSGVKLAGLIDPPQGEFRGWGVFSHGFTLGKDCPAAARMCKQLAAEGARVVVNDIGVGLDGSPAGGGSAAQSVVDEITAAGGEAVANGSNVADWAQAEGLIQAAIDAFGGLDVLVNNAGRHDFRRTTEVTDEQWAHDIALNLSGAFFLSQAAIPHLLESSSGNIVNVASVAGVMGEAYSAAYTAAKHGIVGLTKALAIEYLKTPLRVNCVCPGGMDTPQAHTIDVPDGADWELIMRVAAQRGFMDADDVAAVITFLASDDAKAVHGSIQVVDYGRTAG
jgi:NAD(P)-dependent dehydrogenase (short-subunit alcohol dehydrogenase family)